MKTNEIQVQLHCKLSPFFQQDDSHVNVFVIVSIIVKDRLLFLILPISTAVAWVKCLTELKSYVLK
jgi:hypothetical protein